MRHSMLGIQNNVSVFFCGLDMSGVTLLLPTADHIICELDCLFCYTLWNPSFRLIT